MHLRRVALLAEYAWLACVLLVHAVDAGYCVYWRRNYSDLLFEFVTETLPFAQFALLSLWLTLGPGKLRWRWLAIPSAVGLAWLWEFQLYGLATYAFEFFLFITGLLIATSLVFWLTGWRLVGSALNNPSPNLPLQFSIRTLLVLTAVAAVVSACGKWVYDHTLIAPDGPFSGPFHSGLARFVLVLGLAISSLGAGASVFGRWRFAVAGPFALILAGLSGTLVVLLLHDISQWPHFAAWMVFHAAVMQATLLPVRQLGYRLKRPAR